MEIVMAFLLLIGILILDTRPAVTTHAVAREAEGVRAGQMATAPAPEGARVPCRCADGSVVHRDLTLPPTPAAPLASQVPSQGCAGE